MYLTDALQRIRQRLVANQARPETLALVNSNITIYDDLAVLEEQLVQQAAQAAAARAQQEERPLPKPKKYYRQLKEREREEKGD
jgi:uncharacterized protein (DUF849 family)